MARFLKTNTEDEDAPNAQGAHFAIVLTAEDLEALRSGAAVEVSVVLPPNTPIHARNTFSISRERT